MVAEILKETIFATVQYIISITVADFLKNPIHKKSLIKFLENITQIF